MITEKKQNYEVPQSMEFSLHLEPLCTSLNYGDLNDAGTSLCDDDDIYL